MRELTVSFGTASPAVITTVKTLSWESFSTWLTAEPPECSSKDARGWYIPATFENDRRHGDNFVCRDAITLDFDHVTIDTWGDVQFALDGVAYAIYTTFSHTDTAPRFRVVIPLSRSVEYDVFQALVRKVAESIGIELISRESFVPAQMMYSPTRRLGGSHLSHIAQGKPIHVDEWLDKYKDWTDVRSWPHRLDADGIHQLHEGTTRPDEKVGIVGDFCRTFLVRDAIAKFGLPYTPTPTEGRWTYTNGSRPEGAIEYDDGLKFHSHHDTDPARGQHNAFDLVRLHQFGHLDQGGSRDIAVTDRPSYRAMVEFVGGLKEVAGTAASDTYPDLGPAPRVTEELEVDDKGNVHRRFTVLGPEEFGDGPPVDWVVRGVLPRAELAVVYGESGSGKSFLALDLCAAVTRGIEWREKRTSKGRVVYVCAEGAGGFKARMRAYAREHHISLAELPSVIADAPNMLDEKDAALITKSIVDWGKVDVVVIDTLSATTPGGNENSGEDMGLVLSHCKFLHRQTGALVVLIHHSGKDATKGARGWSGLRAAADAEIEVTRNGDFRAATVTKMKDGSDGASWSFKLRPLILGVDEFGEEETSCVVEHTDEAPPGTGKTRSKPSGAVQQLVYDTLKVMAPFGTCDLEDLIEGTQKKMTKKDGKDNRKRDIGRAIDGLSASKILFFHGEDRVSLTTNVQIDEGAWLQ